VGHLYNTISNGIRTMPSYGSQIEVEDRWAIVAYVKALQRSQHASTDDVPPDKRSQLR
jgi:mono/diheme cytochrome c family protein